MASNLATLTKVLLYNSSNGEVEHEFEFVNTTINDIAISPDGKTFAVALGLARAELYSMDTGEKIMEFNGHQDGVLAVPISPDSKTLLTGSRDTTAIVWDITSGQALKTFAGHTNWVLSVAFSPDGNFIYTAGADQFAYKWSIPWGTIFGSVFEYNKINDIAVSHDGKLMVTVTDRRAEVWDFTSSKPLFVLNHPDWVNSVSFSPEGNYFVTGGNSAFIGNTVHRRKTQSPIHSKISVESEWSRVL